MNHVPAELLAKYGESFVKRLERKDTGDLFLLIAKTKPDNSLERVRKVNSGDSEDAKIALAALGDEKISQKLIDSFMEEDTPKKKKLNARTMAHIGTQRSLHALGSEMRTPLIVYRAKSFKRSVRLHIVEALRFAFPLEEVLYLPIKSDADYEKIERFVEKELNVKWTRERPEFLTHSAWLGPK